MTIVHFTPWSALAGGALIGAAVSLFLWGTGRVAGISGVLGEGHASGKVGPMDHQSVPGTPVGLCRLQPLKGGRGDVVEADSRGKVGVYCLQGGDETTKSGEKGRAAGKVADCHHLSGRVSSPPVEVAKAVVVQPLKLLEGQLLLPLGVIDGVGAEAVFGSHWAAAGAI